jgi:dihydroneopterin aldolase
MRFDALVGILPREREAAQPIEVDLTVQLRDPASDTADASNVVDYRALYDMTAALFASGHIDYLEEIGDRLAAAALGLTRRITAARVAVRKPRVVLGGPLAYAEVVVERRADA